MTLNFFKFSLQFVFDLIVSFLLICCVLNQVECVKIQVPLQELGADRYNKVHPANAQELRFIDFETIRTIDGNNTRDLRVLTSTGLNSNDLFIFWVNSTSGNGVLEQFANSTNGTARFRPVGNVRKAASPLVDISLVQLENFYILTVAHENGVSVYEIQNRKNAVDYLDRVQRIAIEGGSSSAIKQMFLIKGYNGTVFMIISEKLSTKTGFEIRLFAWIDSAFHQTDTETFKMADMLSIYWFQNGRPSFERRPSVFVVWNRVNLTKSQEIEQFMIRSNGELERLLRQNMNIDFFQPYTTLDGSTERFITCLENNCQFHAIVKGNLPTEFVDDNNNNNNNNSDENESTEHSSTFSIENGPQIEKTNRTSFAFAQGLLLLIDNCENGFKIDGFDLETMQSIATNQTDISIIPDSGQLLQFHLWYSEAANRRYVLIVRRIRRNDSSSSSSSGSNKNSNIAVDMAELFVGNETSSSVDRITVNPLKDVVEKLRKILNVRTGILDQANALHRYMTRAKQLNVLKATVIAAGRIAKLQINNPAVILPSQLKKRVTRLREKIERHFSKDKNSRKLRRIRVKSLHVDNLQYSGPLPDFGLHSIEKRQIANLNITELLVRRMNLTGPIRIDNLRVDRIGDSGAIWKNLHETTFLRGRDSFISGTLRFVDNGNPQTRLNVHETDAKYLNSQPISNYFTLTTDQVVNASLFVRRLSVPSVQVATLNGRQMEDFALLGEDNIIESPVRIANFAISKNLILQSASESEFAEHLSEAGNVERFSQIYNGKVRITGTVVIKDVATVNEDSVLSLFDSSKMTKRNRILQISELDRLFWMRRTAQFFQTVRFNNERPIVIGQANTTSLNGHLLSNYSILSSQRLLIDDASLLRIGRATIVGNLNTDLDFSAQPRIESLSSNLVRRHGHAEIFGPKHFARSLIATNIEANTLNGLAANTLLHRQMEKHAFVARKFLKMLRVTDRMRITGSLNLASYNSLDMTDYFNMAARYDHVRFDNLRFLQDVRFDDLHSGAINGISLDGLTGAQRTNKTIIIDGNAIVNGRLTVNRLNQLRWTEYVNLIFRQNDRKPIGGVKYIRGNLTVDASFRANTANDHVDLKRLLEKTLQSGRDQTIAAPWSFQDVQVDNLLARTRINGIAVDNLIDTNSNVKLTGMIVFDVINVKKNIHGAMASTNGILRDLVNQLRFINRPTAWQTLYVADNANWPTDTVAGIYEKIRDQSVRRQGGKTKQTIRGQVRFTVTPEFRAVRAKQNPINIDLTAIWRDALLRRNPNETRVIGVKYFENTMVVDSIEIEASLDIERINGFDILNLNESMYRHSANELIIGSANRRRKMFRTKPIFGHLIVATGHVNSLHVEQVVFAGDASAVRVGLMPIQFVTSVTADSVNIMRLNQFDLNGFVNGRVRISGSPQESFGFVTFNDLRTKRTNLTSINGIDIERVVFKQFAAPQNVDSYKEFRQPVRILGSSSVQSINGAKLMENYRNSIALNRDYRFNRLEFRSGSELSLERGLEIAETSSRKIGEKTIEQNVRHLLEQLSSGISSKLVETASEQNNSPHLLYFEYDSVTKVRWAPPNDGDLTPSVVVREPPIFSIKTCDDCTDSCDTPYVDLMLSFADEQQFYFRNQTRSKTRSFANLTRHLAVGFRNNCSLIRSWLDVEHDEVRNTFDFYDDIIENVWSFNSPHHETIEYMVVGFRNRDQRSSVSLLRFNATDSQLRRIQEFIITEPSIDPRFYRFDGSENVPVLVIAPNQTSFGIYRFDAEAERFNRYAGHDTSDCEMQSQFALFAPPDRDGMLHSILACRGKRTVTVYDPNSQPIQQLILPAGKLVADVKVTQNLGGHFLIVSSTSDWFYVYRWPSSVEGWIPEAVGFVHGLKWTIPVAGSAGDNSRTVFVLVPEAGMANISNENGGKSIDVGTIVKYNVQGVS